MSAPVLYDAPGPRTRALNLVFSLAGLAVAAWLLWIVYSKFDDTGQWDGAKWSPFVHGQVWHTFLLPGILGTLRAFAVASVLSIAFGLLLAVGRLSELRWVRLPAAAAVEFFRAIPLLLLIMFLYYGQSGVLHMQSSIFSALVLGLMFYNGSVLAEVVRAGVRSLPKGQREAGLSIGLTPAQSLRLILLPQAIRAMLPAIIAQLVVVLKDTALGYILAYNELLNQLPKIDGNFRNLIPAAIVIALIYIAMNSTLGGFATWLEQRLRRTPKTSEPIAPPDLAVTAAGQVGKV
jgi:glutamate transport system permease protein